MIPKGTKIAPHNKRSICPLCGSNNINDSDSCMENEAYIYYCECLECGATWEEENSIVFSNCREIKDKDGNSYITIATANRLLEQEDD